MQVLDADTFFRDAGATEQVGFVRIINLNFKINF